MLRLTIYLLWWLVPLHFLHLSIFFLIYAVYFWQKRNGDPLRVYMDLEASRKPSGFEDIFIGYHANDDLQSTYAGSLFHNNRNYHISSLKLNVSILAFHLRCMLYFFNLVNILNYTLAACFVVNFNDLYPFMWLVLYFL